MSFKRGRGSFVNPDYRYTQEPNSFHSRNDRGQADDRDRNSGRRRDDGYGKSPRYEDEGYDISLRLDIGVMDNWGDSREYLLFLKKVLAEVALSTKSHRKAMVDDLSNRYQLVSAGIHGHE